MVNEKNTKAEIFGEYKSLLNRAEDMGLDVPDEMQALSGRENKSVLLNAVDKLQNLLDEEDMSFVQQSLFDEDVTEEPFKESYVDNRSENKSKSKKGEVKSSNDTAADIKQDFSLGTGIDILNKDIIDKIRAVEMAVNMRRDELQKLCVLEKELSEFVDMINADRAEYVGLTKENEERVSAEKARLLAKLDELREGVESRKQSENIKLESLKERIQEKEKSRDELRAKEKEQYEYDWKVRIDHEDDAWEDRSAKRESALKELNADIASLKAELDEKEALVPGLQAKLDEIPSLVEAAGKEGAEEMRRQMLEENDHKKELFRINSEARLAQLEQMLQTLKDDYEERVKERDSLKLKLDKAYEESNKLYLQTVQSTGGIKILDGVTKAV